MPQIKRLGCSQDDTGPWKGEPWKLTGGGFRYLLAAIHFFCLDTSKSHHLCTQELLFFSLKNMASSKSSTANGQYRNTVLRRNIQPCSVHYIKQKWRALSRLPARLIWYLQLWMAAGDVVCRRAGTTVMGLKVPTHGSTCFCSVWFLLILPYYGVGKSQRGEKSIRIQFRITVLCSLAIQGNY